MGEQLLIDIQRMNKFKFQPPQEHRRSLQQPKNEHVTTMSILDKCTQILREDRLFLRNQIKNSNLEVLDIFKLFPRQSQLQHLQTRLRKYVQQVKNRLKNQQLARFKETLSSQIILPDPKRINNDKPSQSTLKAPFKQSASSQLPRSNPRPTRSQQHSATHLNMNSSLRHFQDLLKQKLSQEVIEQRESQNVTSARQGRDNEIVRLQQEHPRTNPPQQEFYDCGENRYPPRTAYNNYIPTKNIAASLNFLNDFNNRDKAKSTLDLPTIKPGPWEFEKKAKQALYQHQKLPNQEDHIQEPIQRSRQKQSMQSEEREDSIFDKHFFTSDKETTPLSEHQQEYHSSISRHNQINNPISLQNNPTFPQLSSSTLCKESKWNEPSIVNFKLKQSNFKETDNEVVAVPKKSIPRMDNPRSSEENLFTPLELLNQCRNFLKYRGDSNQKSNATSQATEMLPTNVLHLPHKHDSIVKQVPENKNQDDSAYIFPEIKQSDKKSKEVHSTQKDENNFNHTHFETFANNNLELKPAYKPLNVKKSVFRGLAEEKISISFSIQDFLDGLMEASEMNPFIRVKDLMDLLNNYQKGQALRAILANELQKGKEEELCLPQLGEIVNQKYNQQHKNYPHEDKTINGVYDLLDIDQKGYVSREDVSAFLSQIEQAEVQNLDEVTEQLWRLFQGADFSNQHRLTYWHFYLVKNSEQFERVTQLLAEFQFQIERNE